MSMMVLSAHTPGNGRFRPVKSIRKNHEAYCDRNGYAYRQTCGDMQPHDLIQPAAWSKIYRIMSCFSECPQCSVFWIDGDAVFADMTRKIERFVSDSCCVTVGRDAGLTGTRFNTGVMLFRNASCARPILNFVHSQRHTYRTRDGMWEQTPFNLYAESHPREFCVRPAGDIQTLIKFKNESRKGFVHHFTMVQDQYKERKGDEPAKR